MVMNHNENLNIYKLPTFQNIYNEIEGKFGNHIMNMRETTTLDSPSIVKVISKISFTEAIRLVIDSLKRNYPGLVSPIIEKLSPEQAKLVEDIDYINYQPIDLRDFAVTYNSPNFISEIFPKNEVYNNELKRRFNFSKSSTYTPETKGAMIIFLRRCEYEQTLCQIII
jgi:hypothetical protein